MLDHTPHSTWDAGSEGEHGVGHHGVPHPGEAADLLRHVQHEGRQQGQHSQRAEEGRPAAAVAWLLLLGGILVGGGKEVMLVRSYGLVRLGMVLATTESRTPVKQPIRNASGAENDNRPLCDRTLGVEWNFKAL